MPDESAYAQEAREWRRLALALVQTLLSRKPSWLSQYEHKLVAETIAYDIETDPQCQTQQYVTPCPGTPWSEVGPCDD